MIKLIQIGILCLLILLLSYQEGMAKSSANSISKDSEFNDPLQELENQEEVQQKNLEQESMEAQGKSTLDKNKKSNRLLKPRESSVNSKSSNIKINKKSANSESDFSNSKLNQSQNEISPDENVIVDTEVDAMVNLGDEKVDEAVSTTAALPRWNAKDPNKGFLNADPEDGYFYKEDSNGYEREISGDYKVNAKSDNFKRGLLYVSSDGSYIYSGKDSEKEGSISVRFARLSPLLISNTVGPNNNITFDFESMYGSSPFGLILIDYDWLTFRRFGHWILSLGTGIGQVEGAGRFKDDGTEAFEHYTFYTMINHISFTYRFQYADHPWLVPYISGGAVPSLLIERRDDNKIKKTFVASAQVSAGARFNIGKLDSYGSASLDSEYGINNLLLM